VQLPGQPYAIDQQVRALGTDDLGVIAALLDSGADLTFGISQAGCRPKIIQLYLDRGVAVDAHPPMGAPLLFTSVESGSKRHLPGSWTPEQEERRQACLQTAAYLVAHGARIQGDRNARTPLAEAVSNGDLDYLKLFAEAGADFNERPEPLIFEALHEYGISVSASRIKPDHRDDYRWPLRTVEFLLAHGANPNIAECGRYDAYEEGRRFPYMTGETPLMVAARYGWYDMAKLLLQNGADPLVGRKEVEEDIPMIPSAIAIENGHAKTAALIQAFERRSSASAAPPAGASSPAFSPC
jgi:ankyrin repeat protein